MANRHEKKSGRPTPNRSIVIPWQSFVLARPLALGSIAAWTVLSIGARAAEAAEGLNLFPEPRSLLINLGLMALLIYPVNRLLLRPLVRILQEREAQTSGSVQRASVLRTEALETAQTVDAQLREARAEAQRIRTALLGEAESEERKVLEQAREESSRAIAAVRSSVAAELAGAREGLREQATLLARDVAGKVMGRSL